MFLVGPIRNVRWSSLKLLANWWIANQETTRLASSVSSLLYRNLHNNVSIGDKDAEIKRVRIYTRTGDKGKSSLLTGIHIHRNR